MNEYGHIYQIRCLENGKILTGQSVNVNQRKTNHFSQLRNNKHQNKQLQEDFIKYGEDSFEFNIVDGAEDIDELNRKEVAFNMIAGFPNQSKVYNQSYGGEARNRKTWASSIETTKKHSKSTTSTGIKGLYKPTNSKYNVWRFQYTENKKRKVISKKGLWELKKLVESMNLPWIVVDEEKARKTMAMENQSTTNALQSKLDMFIVGGDGL